MRGAIRAGANGETANGAAGESRPDEEYPADDEVSGGSDKRAAPPFSRLLGETPDAFPVRFPQRGTRLAQPAARGKRSRKARAALCLMAAKPTLWG